MTKDVQRWADPAMFEAEPMPTREPKVYLLEMTSDPLGSIAALSAMYTGKVTRSKEDVTDEERAHHLKEMSLTYLTTPLESVRLHFMIEGVTRAFTHQLVRNRTSAYAQESLRFAVVEDMPVAYPPSLRNSTSESEVIRNWVGLGLPRPEGHETRLTDSELEQLDDRTKQRVRWDRTVQTVREAYTELVETGMPAEDARGLVPTNVQTRINWVTDLRTLISVLGVRLCTQAQFEWRAVATQIAEQIAGAWTLDRRVVAAQERMREASRIKLAGAKGVGDGYLENIANKAGDISNRVKDEYHTIASLFRPICYQTGKCEFNGAADRSCSIRSRVEANHKIGRPSSEWTEEYDRMDPHEAVMYNPGLNTVSEPDGTVKFIGSIQPREWMMDPEAAR